MFVIDLLNEHIWGGSVETDVASLVGIVGLPGGDKIDRLHKDTPEGRESEGAPLDRLDD